MHYRRVVGRIASAVLCAAMIMSEVGAYPVLAAEVVSEENEVIVEETTETSDIAEEEEIAESELIDEEVLRDISDIDAQIMAEGSLSGKCGDNLTYKLTGNGVYTTKAPKGYTLTITGKGDMYDYASYDDVPWGAANGALASVSLPSGMTSIGDYAFYANGWRNIEKHATTIKLPSSLKRIGDYAFCSEMELTTMTIPEGVTYIGKSAFSNCQKLKSITLPGTLAEMGEYAFNTCLVLEKVSIPGSLKKIPDSAFNCCSALKSVKIGEGVQVVGNMAFYSCAELGNSEELVLPSTLRRIGGCAFYSCSGIKKITIPAAVEYIDKDAFKVFDRKETEALTITTSSTWKSMMDDTVFDLVNDYDNMLANIYRSDIDRTGKCGDSLTWRVEKIDENSDRLIIEGTGAMYDYDYDSYNSGSAPWSDTEKYSIKEIVLPEGLTYIGAQSLCMSQVSEINIPSTVKEIGEEAFVGSNELVTSITIPDSVEKIGKRAFSRFSRVSELTLGSGLKEIGESAFSNLFSKNCNAGTITPFSLTIPASVEKIGPFAFHNAGITSLTFEEGCALKTIENQSFASCMALSELNLHEGLEKIGHASFQSCKRLLIITTPSTLKSIGHGAFTRNGTPMDARTVTLNEGLETIGRMAFRDDKNIASITIPSTVKKIGDEAFSAEIKDNFTCSGKWYTVEGEEVGVTEDTGGSYAHFPKRFVYRDAASSSDPDPEEPVADNDITNTEKYEITCTARPWAGEGKDTLADVVVKVKATGAELIAGTDYALVYENNSGFGTAKVTVFGIGSYIGSKTFTYKIEKPNFSKATDDEESALEDGKLYVKAIDNCVYSGAAQKPEIVVKYNGESLTEGADYTVKYKKNVNAGTASVDIKGKKNYAGKATKTFTINKLTISDNKISVAVPSVKLASGSHTTKPVVTLLDETGRTVKTLKAGKDYTVSFANNTAKTAEAECIITAKDGSNFCDSRTETFAISDKNIADSSLVIFGTIDAKSYTGAPVTVSANELAEVVKSASDGSTIEYGRDYKVAYFNNVNAGKAVLRVIGTGEFYGTKDIKFTISKYDMGASDAEYTLLFDGVEAGTQTYDYTGAKIKPVVTLTFNGRKLTEGKDFKVKCTANKNVGKATATIKLKGSFKGSISKEFEIKSWSLEDAGTTIEVADADYNFGKPVKAKVTVKRAFGESFVTISPKAVKLEYKDNTNPGTAEVKITPAKSDGYITGSVTENFTVAEIDIQKASVGKIKPQTLGDGAVEPAVTVKIGKKKLTKDRDYTLSYSNNTAKGTAAVEITAVDGSGFAGSKTVYFTIK